MLHPVDEAFVAEAGIVAGRVANAAALNDVFARFVQDATNVRAFQTLLIRDQVALFGRVEALEAVAGIVDPPAAGSLEPNEDEVSVPHTFATGSPMRASEMNANLQAVDAACVAEVAMATAIAARQAVLARMERHDLAAAQRGRRHGAVRAHGRTGLEGAVGRA